MSEHDLLALESYQLLPRVLHDVHEVDSSLELLGRALDSPILPLLTAGVSQLETLSLLAADAVLAQGDSFHFERAVPLLEPQKMGELMPKMRKLAARHVPAIALDLSLLAESAPFGFQPWKPKTREDLAELAAAAGCPLWIYGIASPADAEIAAEAGLDAIVVYSGAGDYLGGPATIEILPEIVDAVAGMTAIYAGGPVRSGIDVFRYLAVGAEAVVVDSDRALTNLGAELHYAMRLTACETLTDISYDAIFAPLFGEL